MQERLLWIAADIAQNSDHLFSVGHPFTLVYWLERGDAAQTFGLYIDIRLNYLP